MKQALKRSNLFKLISVTVILFLLPSVSQSASRFCTGLPKTYQQRVSKKFDQNPFFLVESFLNLPHQGKSFFTNVQAQNSLLRASFDINRIYRSNKSNFKSTVLSKLLLDWVRTQYFNNINQNFTNKSKHLLKKNFDLLTNRERNQVSSHQSVATSIESKKCSKEETSLLGCKNIFIVTAQSSPAISCKNKQITKSFESKFYLTFSKRYGFKILDISVAGKRIVLDSMKHMMSLKRKGFNKNAIASHISILSKDPNTFKFPKKQIHTKKFLANLKLRDSNRLPSSL